MVNPILEKSRYVALYFLAWMFISVVHAFILVVFYTFDLPLAIADALVYNLFFAAIAIGLWYVVRYLNISDPNAFSVVMNHLAVATVFLAIWLTAALFLLRIIGAGNTVYLQFLEQSVIWRFFSGIFYYLVIILVYYLFIYYNSFKENLVKEAKLKSLVKETELSLLKSQLNPHFIFNSLNSISALTISDPPRAQDMVIKLSSFLRSALEQNQSTFIPFSEELKNTLLYLDIEKTRFGERLVLERDLEEACEDLPVPNMLLQPLLENAVKHGVYESTAPTTIRLSCKKEGEFIHIKISNTFDPQAVSKKGRGIGLKNVKERLYLLYGRNDLIKIEAGRHAFGISIYLPVN